MRFRVNIEPMNTPANFALRSVAALLILAIGLVLYILFGDLSVHKDRILAAASDATGFYIASPGPFDLHVGREISLSASNVTIGNPAWPDEHPLATTATVNVVVDTWSIVSGPLEIDSLAISGAHVNLKSAEDGSANWIPAPDSEAEDDTEEPGPDPLIYLVTLDDVRVSHEEAGETRFFSETSTLHMSRTGPNSYDFDIDETLDGTSFVAKGSLQFAANLSVDKPAIDVDISMSQLQVASSDDALPVAPHDESEEDDALLFSTEPLSYSWLSSLDLDADIRIANASLDGNELSDLVVVASIQDTALAIGPVEFALGEGKFLGSLELTPADEYYALVIEALVDNLRLAQLADDEQDPATVPPLNATLSLTGTGKSMHEIMASSNGRLSGRQDRGHLNLQSMGALFSDFLTSIVRTLNPLAEERTYTNLECGIFEVAITDGVANIEEMALQSDRLTIVSSGNINFETEALDLTLNTKSREGLGVSVGDVANSFIKLGGTLKEPALGVDAVGSVTTTGAAIATGGLSLLAKGLWDRVSSEVDICAQADASAD